MKATSSCITTKTLHKNILMPVPGNHPNLCVRRVCSTGLGAERTLPVKHAPQTTCPRTHLEKMYQIQTIKKRLHPIWRCRKPVNRFRWVMARTEQCLDARRNKGVYADNFMKDSVAIATVWLGDGRRCCTLTLCVAVQRSVLRQVESCLGDVKCSCASARAQEVRCAM